MARTDVIIQIQRKTLFVFPTATAVVLPKLTRQRAGNLLDRRLILRFKQLFFAKIMFIVSHTCFWCLIYAFLVLFILFIPDLIQTVLYGGGNVVRNIQNNYD